MNTMKKFFALILSLCMILSMVPVSAFAAESDDAGDAMVTGTDSTTDTIKPETPAGLTNQTEPFPLSLFTTYNSSSNGHYRIPGIVTLDDGTLVASADARWHQWISGEADDYGNIDSVVSYSTNNGKTWNVNFANYYGGSNPYGTDDGSATFIDPGIITDGTNLYMIADIYPGQNERKMCTQASKSHSGYDSDGHLLLRENGKSNDTNAKYYLKSFTSDGHTYYEIYTIDGNTKQENQLVDAWFNLYTKGENDTWNYYRNLFAYSENSYMPIMTSHLYLTTSTDGGTTWSEPTMLNPYVRETNDSSAYYLVSPGRGLTTSDGTLVIGAYGNYSGEKASIIFYDGQSWHRSSQEAPTSSSESEIVELSDGTLRMFVRHAGYGNTVVQYFDWTPVKDANGKVTDYTPSAAVSTSVPSDKNVNISAISYSRDADGKQVILVAVAAATEGLYPRKNGKIYTFVVNDDKTMTLKKGYEITGESEAYSYSCLTELADGTIGLLYEKGDSGNITWAIYDAEAVTGLDLSKDIVNEEAKVTVTVPNSSNVTHLVATRKTDIEGLTSDSYAAYDLTLCTCTGGTCDGTNATPYTGSATVTIPISDDLAAKNLIGFVQNSDGTFDYVYSVEIDAEAHTATFKAPHFSVVGVMEQTTQDYHVTVAAGSTSELVLDGNVTALTQTPTIADDAKASVTLTPTQGTVKTAIEDVEAGSYLIKAINTGSIGSRPYLTTTTGDSGALMRKSAETLNTSGWAEAIWNIVPNGNTCTISDLVNGKYITIPSGNHNPVTLSDSPVTLNWQNHTGVANEPGISIGVNGYWMNPRDTGATLTYDAADNGSRMNLIPVTGTTVTITGLSAGTTDITLGNVTIHVTVTGEQDVNLHVGETIHLTQSGSNVTGSVTDNATVSVDYTGYKGNYWQIEKVTGTNTLTDGEYLIFFKRTNYALTSDRGSDEWGTETRKLQASGIAPNDVNTWTITAVDGGYTIKHGDKYLALGTGNNAAALSDTDETLYITWDATESAYFIKNSTETLIWLDKGNNTYDSVGGWEGGSANFDLYRVVRSENANAHTVISVTGNAVGDTALSIGNMTYNFHVTESVQNITAYAGQTLTITDETGNYTQDYRTGNDWDNSIATLDTVAGTTSINRTGFAPVNAIESGKQYLIVYVDNNKILTSNKNSDGNRLQLDGNWNSTASYWTITRSGNGYTVMNSDGHYLNIPGEGQATLGVAAQLAIACGSDGTWTINQNDYYLNNYAGNDYAAGWKNSEAATNSNSQWALYEVTGTATSSTTATVNCLSGGDVSLRIGYTTYNIHILDETVNIELNVDEDYTDTIYGYKYDSATTQPNEAYATVNVSAKEAAGATEVVSSITSGKRYVIANARGAFNNQNNVLTPVADTENCLKLSGSPSDVDAASWIIEEKSDGTYTIQDSVSGKYLYFASNSASLRDNPTRMKLTYVENNEYTGAGYWLIQIVEDYLHSLGGKAKYHAGGFYNNATNNPLGDSGTYWYLYEATPERTEVTFHGVAKGETTVRVGHINYNIKVVEPHVDVSLFVGEKFENNYEIDNVTDSESIDNTADVTWTTKANIVTVSVTAKNVGTTTVKIGNTNFNITVVPFEKQFSLAIDTTASFELNDSMTEETVDAFNNQCEQYVKASIDADNGKIVFTGVSEGAVNCNLGNTRFKINVTPVVVPADDTKYIGGQGEGNNQKITSLVLSDATTYRLTWSDSEAAVISWESSNTDLFTVDNGLVTTVEGASGTGYITVTADGVTQTIPVTVIPTKKGTTNRILDYYNTGSQNCTAYYSYQSGELIEYPEGCHIYIQHDQSESDFISFWAVPVEGYALTYMNSTTGGYYHSVTREDGVTYGSGYGSIAEIPTHTEANAWAIDQLVGSAVRNANAATEDEVLDLLQRAIALEADGMFLFSRKITLGGSNAKTTFVAERLPSVEKEIKGILGSDQSYAEYQDGMFAEVGDLVYFKVTVTFDKPIYWEGRDKDHIATTPDNAVTDDNGLPLAALEYKNAQLLDLLDDTYFYDVALDENPDGIITDGALNSKDITADMNRGWEEDEIENGRVLTYYVYYQITEDDVTTATEQNDTDSNDNYYKFDSITNRVELSYTYTSTYSIGTKDTNAQSSATIRVLGKGLKDVVVDFGLPVVLEGLTTAELPVVPNAGNSNKAAGGCIYGMISIEEAKDDDGATVYNITYTPTEIMTGYDLIYLMDDNNQLINYFRVFPANNVYYEETFASFGNVDGGKGSWESANGNIGNQKYQDVGCMEKEHKHNAFGYDDAYKNGSNSTATSTMSGDTATFTFAGTGFDLYANTNTKTSNIAVLVYKVDQSGTSADKLVKFYQVITANKKSEGIVVPDSTENIPVVSITDLPTGNYKVVVRHIKSATDTESEIILDGYRIYYDLTDVDDKYPDEEREVTFTELRDYVLSALEVDTDSTCDQVYSKIEGANATVSYLSNNADAANDLLKYGPKNEIWMNKGDTLSFTLDERVKYAQIGLKAPTGSAKVTINVMDGEKKLNIEEPSIITATDMFYRLNNANTAYNGSVTVIIQVTEGFLSVTKLKTSTYVKDPTSDTPAATQALAPVSHQQIAVALNVMYGTKTESPAQSVVRYSGSDRYATAISVANEMLALRGLEKFDTVIVASGSNFADALAGSYLASKTCAPILLSGTKDSQNARVVEYIKTHLAENGTVYILGGDAAVPESYDQELASFTVKRLAGATRYETNLEILKETGIPAASEILVCTGVDYADSLSAAATGRPILLVSSKNGVSYGIHDEYLRSIEGLSFTIIGGDGAVSLELEEQLSAYGTTRRLSGKTRYETSVLVAQTYFPDAEDAALAYAWEFPDGLCGGPLACALNVPILLLSDTNYAAAQDYIQQQDISDGIVLGGDSRIADSTIRQVFALAEDATITVK